MAEEICMIHGNHLKANCREWLTVNLGLSYFWSARAMIVSMNA